jgi:tRNA (guanosine-2'-O-)-methyltransferase
MTTPKRSELFSRVAAARQSGLIVVLEDVHDPHNAMAILRTCDAFGIQEIYFIFDQEPEFNPTSIGNTVRISGWKT